MFRAHRDRHPNVMIWLVILYSADALKSFGACSPYLLLVVLGSALWTLTLTVGLYVVVIKMDNKAERKDVQNGYKFLTGFAMSGIQYFVLFITRFESSLNVFAVSSAHMIFRFVVLKVMVPNLKLCFGNDERKLWTYCLPALLLALELGPCLLLLGSNMKTIEFWALLIFQELNSVAKNTGKYAELYLVVRARLRRPVGGETIKLMEERRKCIVPCDNIGEIASPVVLALALGLESLFDGLAIGRAPYFAKTGTMGAWRNQRFRGEALAMMTTVFAVRLVFCCAPS